MSKPRNFRIISLICLIVVASSARRGKAAVDTAKDIAAATATGKNTAGAAAAAARGGDTEEAPAMAEARGVSALSVADRVVTEYEKLLEAIPTMARHMGRLQEDTETMAEGELAPYQIPCRTTPSHLVNGILVPPVAPHLFSGSSPFYAFFPTVFRYSCSTAVFVGFSIYLCFGTGVFSTAFPSSVRAAFLQGYVRFLVLFFGFFSKVL